MSPTPVPKKLIKCLIQKQCTYRQWKCYLDYGPRNVGNGSKCWRKCCTHFATAFWLVKTKRDGLNSKKALKFYRFFWLFLDLFSWRIVDPAFTVAYKLFQRICAYLEYYSKISRTIQLDYLFPFLVHLNNPYVFGSWRTRIIVQWASLDLQADGPFLKIGE